MGPGRAASRRGDRDPTGVCLEAGGPSPIGDVQLPHRGHRPAHRGDGARLPRARRVTLFVDANVPMYVVGAPHPNKDRAVAALEVAVARGERLVTDAEVLQEILHRYRAIGRPDAMEAASEALLSLVDEVFPIERDDVITA